MELAAGSFVFPRRPGRIVGFSYVGLHRYSVTICTFRRKSVFVTCDDVDAVLMFIRQCGSGFGFVVHAYCFMPDLVVAAKSEQSDFRRFMSNWKQRSGYQFKQQTGERLWQDSYFDHVLRDDEQTQTAMKYVLENPVRKGMVATFEDYRACGSDLYTVSQLMQFWH